MVEQYIKVYEWILRHPELSRFEALLVCEIMRWPEGCYKSAQSLANLFGTDKRHIQRMLKSLQKREWLAILHTKRQSRILYATPKEPPIGPLFDYKLHAEESRAEHRKRDVRKLIQATAGKLSVNDKS